jgi:hypothetical protein
LREKIVDVASAVKNTDHVDTGWMRQVEHEIVFKSVDGDPAQAFQAGNAGIVPNAALRMIDQSKAGGIDAAK